MGISIKVTTPEEDRAEREQVLDMSRTELEKYLIHGDCGDSAQKLAMQRLALLDIAPPWYRSSMFIVGLFAMVFAAIAAWPVVREWFPKRAPAADHLRPQPEPSRQDKVTQTPVLEPTLAGQHDALPNPSPTPTLSGSIPVAK